MLEVVVVAGSEMVGDELVRKTGISNVPWMGVPIARQLSFQS